MEFNRHPNIEGQHAFLGASKYHWINYDEEKLADSFIKFLAVQRGTTLHEFAHMCIELGQKLPRTKQTLNMFVNDAIGFHMNSEQPLYYSENCFGTADAISFEKNLLRIHDYKSGDTPASIHQLEVYAALFCLEYGHKPGDIDIELRIYQCDEILAENPGPELIAPIMDKIVTFDKLLSKLKSEV